jgi:hypothetical protein
VEFGTAQARLAYVQGLAKAIEQNTGIKTEAQSYANVAALKKDAVDFAIIDGVCYATNLGWKLLATANIGGGTTRPWALYSSAGDTMQALKGKKLAFIGAGCNDAGFADNAMPVRRSTRVFSSRVGNPVYRGGRVASYKSAQAVFAPVGTAKNLTKVFDTGSAPNPAFVELGGKLPQNIIDKVGSAVIGFGGGGAIGGWTRPAREIYQSLAGRFGKVVKQGVMANPDPVRIDAKDVLIDPPTLRDSAVVDVRHHFVRPPGARME